MRPRRRASRPGGRRARSSPTDLRGARRRRRRQPPSPRPSGRGRGCRGRSRRRTAANAPTCGQVGQRRDGVHGRVEDQLRPLRRPQVGEGARVEARLRRAAPRPPAPARTSAVPAKGPSQVSVSSSYSTCVSPWRTPLMNVTAESSGQPPCARTSSSAPRPFWIVISVAPGKRPASAAAASSSWVAFVARIAEVEVGQLGGVGGRVHARGEVRLAGDPQAVGVEGAGVLVPPGEDADLGDARQVARRRGCRSPRAPTTQTRSIAIDAEPNPLGSDGVRGRSRARVCRALRRHVDRARLLDEAEPGRAGRRLRDRLQRLLRLRGGRARRPRVGRRALAVPARRRCSRRAARSSCSCSVCARQGRRGRR